MPGNNAPGLCYFKIAPARQIAYLRNYYIIIFSFVNYFYEKNCFFL